MEQSENNQNLKSLTKKKLISSIKTKVKFLDNDFKIVDNIKAKFKYLSKDLEKLETLEEE